ARRGTPGRGARGVLGGPRRPVLARGTAAHVGGGAGARGHDRLPVERALARRIGTTVKARKTMLHVAAALAALVVLAPAPAAAAPPQELALVARGATWRYLDDGSDQGSAWRQPAFSDARWRAGP